MNRFLAAGFVGMLFLSCSTVSKSPPLKESEVVPLSGNFNVNRYELGNGLRVLVVEDHSSPTFAYQTWFRVGSRDETPGKTGLAHLFEHMMFKETKTMKDGEFDRLLESNGAEGENAFTSRDYTAYIQELPSNKLEMIAKAESDRMTNLIVNDKGFKTEREVVQNERRFRTENNPDGTLDQELFGLAFKKHPYRWPVIGYQKDLAEMNAQDAEAFYRTHYSPNHATVVVVGDVNPKQTLATIEKYYGSIPRQPSEPQVISPEPPQASPRHKTVKLNIQVEKLIMGYRIPAATHSDTPALSVIQSLLTGGKSSRLNRALVDTGVASTVGSFDFEDKDPSLFVIQVNLQKNKSAAQAEAIILREISRLSDETLSDQELERAKNKLNFSFYSSLDSNFEKAYFLGHYESVASHFREGITQHQKVQLVTATDVKKSIRNYLNPKNRTVITGVKK